MDVTHDMATKAIRPEVMGEDIYPAPEALQGYYNLTQLPRPRNYGTLLSLDRKYSGILWLDS